MRVTLGSESLRRGSIRADRRRVGPLVQLGPLALYMFVFFVVPVGVFLLYSFWTVREWDVVRVWNLANYRDVFSSPVYPQLILRSLGVGVATAVLSVVVVYPLAFVSEHSETLVELDRDYRRLAESCGVPFYRRAPTVGTDPRFIAGLARLARRETETQTVTQLAEPPREAAASP